MSIKCALCKNDGTHTVDFVASAVGHASRIRGHFNVLLCDSHAQSVEQKDLVDEKGWNQIQFALLSKGKALLDRNSLKLKMVPIAQ
jgi:hypothetical protein